MKKLDNETLMSLIARLRNGDIRFNSIRKKELWQVVEAFIQCPVVGLEDADPTQKAYEDELRRIVDIYFDNKNIDPHTLINEVASHTSYNTFAVLIQFVHYHIMAMAEAKSILASRPGEIDSLVARLEKRAKETEAVDLSSEHNTVDVSVLLLSELIRFIADMTQSAEAMLNIVNKD